MRNVIGISDPLRLVMRAFALIAMAAAIFRPALALGDDRPNILFIISDDVSWAHASAYGDPVVKTPAFDRVAEEGTLFTHAFCSVPSCSPSRSAILTGQDFWRLEEAANLRGTLHRSRFDVYPFLLEESGYAIGSHSKLWSPGSVEAGGWPHNPTGPAVNDFERFLKSLPEDRPFCFWQGSRDAHRPFKAGSGSGSGLKAEDVEVPAFLPDVPLVREDILDYYFEVERFDRLVASHLDLLEETGRAENTIVVVTSDNGMPFPRGKADMYDYGARMPLAIRWPRKAPGNRVIHDFVNLIDLAPTFLEAAGLEVDSDMTGKSLLPLLVSGEDGWVDPSRDAAYYGREAHSVFARIRENRQSFPSRAIRTKEFLYIRNFEPDRWPVGREFKDVDPSPTRTYVIEREAELPQFFALSFGKRPEEELYDLRADPYQVVNVAGDPRFTDRKRGLSNRLTTYLTQTNDPRMGSDGEVFDRYPIWGVVSGSNPRTYERLERGSGKQE